MNLWDEIVGVFFLVLLGVAHLLSVAKFSFRVI